MTVNGGTICSLIQTFPVLLILAQNHNKCLKTPLVYKPPTPTHSPEYYEALDALFQSIYGHSYQGGHGHGGHSLGGHIGHAYEGHTIGNTHFSYPDSHNCQYTYGYGKKSYSGVSYGKPCYQYVFTNGNGYHSYGSSLQGYPSYGLKSGHIYSLDSNYSAVNYAPNQVYNTKNKYKVVVKKTKIGGRRRKDKVFETHLPLTDQENSTNHKVSRKQPRLTRINRIKLATNHTDLDIDKNKQNRTKSTIINTNSNEDYSKYDIQRNLKENSTISGNLFANNGNSSFEREMTGERICKVGECIPLYKCGVFMRIIEARRKIGGVVQMKVHCGFEGIHPKVCCPVPVPTPEPQAEDTS